MAAAPVRDSRRVVSHVVSDEAARQRGTVLLIILAVAALMVTYVETLLVPALPVLVGFFQGVPYTTIAWVVSGYLLLGVSTTPIFAKLGDIYGKKRMLLVVLGVYAAAVSVTGFTPQIASMAGISAYNAVYLLIAARSLQGIGLAMFPLALSMVAEELPPTRVAQAQGLIGGMFAVGASLGLFVGGWLVVSYGWQFAYHTVIPLALGVVGAAAFILPESRHRLQERLDVPGAALLSGALALFLLGISQGPTWGWSNLAATAPAGIPIGVPSLCVVSAALAALFVWRERTAAEPMVVLERFRDRNLALSYLMMVLVGVAMYLGFVAITIYVETPVVGLGRTAFEFGQLSLPTTIGMLVAAPLIGVAISRWGPRPVATLGAVTSVSGFLLLLTFNQTYLAVLLSAIPAFVGLVAVLISATNVILLSARQGEGGIQTGLAEMFQDLGASVGPVVVAAVLASFTTLVVLPTGVVTLPSLDGFRWVFALGAGLIGFAGVLSVFLRNYTLTPTEESAKVDTGAPAGSAMDP